MLDVTIELHAQLKRRHRSDGVNIGLNNGTAALPVVASPAIGFAEP